MLRIRSIKISHNRSQIRKNRALNQRTNEENHGGKSECRNQSVWSDSLLIVHIARQGSKQGRRRVARAKRGWGTCRDASAFMMLKAASCKNLMAGPGECGHNVMVGAWIMIMSRRGFSMLVIMIWMHDFTLNPSWNLKTACISHLWGESNCLGVTSTHLVLNVG